MKDGILKFLGITFICLGIIGFLLMGTNILGFVISETEESKLTISEIGFISQVSGAGPESTKINIKNDYNEELTNCLLIAEEKGSEWVTNEEVKNIPANSNIDFNLEIDVPKETETDDYPISLKISCDQDSSSKSTSISVTQGINAIKIRNLKSGKRSLKVTYTFDPKGFIGDSTYTEIWVLNPDQFEINRVIDKFAINTKKLIVREVEIDLKENPKGVYSVFFSHPTDKNNYIKKSIILGKSSTTGNAIFNISEGKGIPYLGFLIFIGIGIFFIFRSHRKAIQSINQPNSINQKLKPIK